MFKPVQIADGIYSVGCRDWDIRDFHGYSTYEGTSYNAFLILDEKNVLVDTVKKEFTDELLDNISKIIDPAKIDLVISNHTEMDHSGALPGVMQRIGQDKTVLCSKMGLKNLRSHFTGSLNLKAVDNGEELSIGKRTLTFIETKMLHWPDSMFTYIKDEGILFSSDAFGQHYAGDCAFDDEIGDAVMDHAAKYYANILLNYSSRVQDLLESVKESGLDIRMICPDHGVIWRDDPGKIIAAYDRWSRQECDKKAVVLFDTMWSSTAKMAREIAKGIESVDVKVRLMNTRKCHRSDIMTEVMDATALIVGSPTLNNGIFPVVADVMTYIKGLKPKNRMAAAFGSYGWSGEAVKILNQEFDAMKMEIVDQGFKVQYVPKKEDLDQCFELGKKIGLKIVERIENK
ncbi:Nitric oxide reductase [Desulfamplus magnetovallimortis]|uniref:Nitric oxide reductase n=1 Tax=Desulfamplus magnetovallimortis TaxID=1246637 RepID=A0A1W1H829_9BACT|nr:FprA family A-type flavoprotein [Desulfamplus magnetovallimortis]SLM28640.1 Nitric oxide reductase [Desulfamplus magnetovallimortis]